MAKTHDYPEDLPRCVDCGEALTAADFEIEAKRQTMLERCLESIEDLMNECVRGGAVLSIQQREEMENIIKDARVQRLTG